MFNELSSDSDECNWDSKGKEWDNEWYIYIMYEASGL